MNAREAARVLVLVAAAGAAALSFRVAARAREWYAPVHGRRFDAACAALPVLGGVRVRSDQPGAGVRLVASLGVGFREVLRPQRAEAMFRRGRLLYATPEEVTEVLAEVRAGEPPRTLPALPDLQPYYEDAQGPYDCDVILKEGATTEGLRALLPDARLAGEPVAIEEEDAAGRTRARALLVALLAVGVWRAWRGGIRDAERRLLASLASLAALGLSGLGADPWTVAAVVLVAGASEGAPLLAGAAALLFPSTTLQRIGVVLLVGGIVRLRRPAPRAGGAWRGTALFLLLLGGGGALLGALLPVAVDVPSAVAGDAAVTFVPADVAAERAATLRAEGFEHVVGGARLVPPPATLERRRQLVEIHARATTLARRSEGERAARFRETAEAAAVDELFLPHDLAARLFTRDGRAALWVLDDVDPERAEFESGHLYRTRGEAQLEREGRLAGALVFVLAGAGLVWARGRRAWLPLLWRFTGAAAGLAVLMAGEGAGTGAFPPLLVLAAVAPAAAVPLGLGAAALAPPAIPWTAGAFAVAAGLGWLTRRR